MRSLGTRCSRASGSSELRLQKATKAAKLLKSLDVTPNKRVKMLPKNVPAKDPPLERLISVANRLASTPCA